LYDEIKLCIVRECQSLFGFDPSSMGSTENAGPENEGPKMQGWKMQDWKMPDRKMQDHIK